MKILTLTEHQVTAEMQGQISALVDVCFSENFGGRFYFKQRAHVRILALEEDSLVGQIGIDCRVINVSGTVLKIFGILDVCVHPDQRNAGIATKLLKIAEELARQSDQDFMVLMASKYAFYGRCGYQRVQPAPTKWLAIEDCQSVKLLEEDLSDCFMVNQLGGTPWPAGQIDLLGYKF